ncbi:hypothetical protein VD0002_g6244 [Verticillium dahliae]|uniref:Uncharacterized protein n=2 Tax=Verticillium dahliae TaxID=27337 RepID=G2X0F3_VERDV|nr:uncharacterized protein VDAG_03732 [Verticillium dahliae VdLs.17]PNH33443.1 hypothetical protein BJF96_g3174 [Verticillium dahliae]EGY22294.1 hypothetical protein VDAG_03732 [Verticillium dahliae VdLs.17]PNH38852.1 hypothetical protein VD0004_g8014 [Verticillium dahliae]PNH49653.1 hypothetical protein VD0003_g7498 [Verticillium dahliae]PNH61599.1 hypothetical protein VD0002_g6244 [Verticillium dahliae]
MAAKFVSRISGTSAVLERASWSAFRQSQTSTIRPTAANLADFVHFVIPTPFIMDGDNMKSMEAQVRFVTGSGARVTRILVFDGETQRYAQTFDPGLQHQNMRVRDINIQGDPRVTNSLVISLRVVFSGTGPDDFIRFSWAAIHFDNV